MLMFMFITVGQLTSTSRGTFHQQTSQRLWPELGQKFNFTFHLPTESVVNNAASLTSDDEDEGADDEDSAEGSADQMLVF